MLIVDKNTGDELSANEFNQIPDEIEKVISDTGQTPSAVDVEQLSKGIYRLASEATWYTDSGAADAYILTSAGGVTDLPDNFDGKLIRFTPMNSNTGTAEVNVNGDGLTPLVDIAGVALVGGEILAGQETIATFISSSGNYRLLTEASTSGIQIDNAIEDSDQTLDISDLFQLSNAFSNFSGSGSFYGTADPKDNDYLMTLIGTRKEPTTLLDGLEVRFKADFTNTGNTTIKLPTLDEKTLRTFDGLQTPPGEIQLNSLVVCYYDLVSDFFRLPAPPTPLTSNLFSLKNLLINPRFAINQRRETSPGLNVYFADRWKRSSVSAGTIAISTEGGIAFMAQDASMDQTIEIETALDSGGNTSLANLTVTLSAELFSPPGAGTVQGIIEGSDGSTLQTTSGPPQDLPFSFTFDAASIGNARVIILASGGTVNLAGVQLEIGNRVTQFDNRPEALDLSMCLRYFEAGSDQSIGSGVTGDLNGNFTHVINTSYHRKRVTPSVSITSNTNFFIRFSNSGSISINGFSATLIGLSGAELRPTTINVVGIAQGNGVTMGTQDINALLLIDSEINFFP